MRLYPFREAARASCERASVAAAALPGPRAFPVASHAPSCGSRFGGRTWSNSAVPSYVSVLRPRSVRHGRRIRCPDAGPLGGIPDLAGSRRTGLLVAATVSEGSVMLEWSDGRARGFQWQHGLKPLSGPEPAGRRLVLAASGGDVVALALSAGKDDVDVPGPLVGVQGGCRKDEKTESAGESGASLRRS